MKHTQKKFFIDGVFYHLFRKVILPNQDIYYEFAEELSLGYPALTLKENQLRELVACKRATIKES